MERIVEKDIFNEMMKTAQPKEVSKWTRQPDGKSNIVTSIKNLSLQEAKEKLEQLYYGAAAELEVNVDTIILTGSAKGTRFEAIRLETNQEMTTRVQWEASYKADKLREANKRKSREDSRKKKQIERLEKELADLKR
jgi:hypothetical protein